MLKTLRDLFESLRPPLPEAPSGAPHHAVALAAAVMLVEVMRADATIAPATRAAVQAGLADRLSLAADESARLAELAETTARESTDLFAFTSRIDERFDMAQKVRMVETMWDVAYADGRLSEHERHVLWRIADLLHVPQGAYVNARLRARARAGVDD
jgi:uncharacterized tellurite resistance protein B-like protein